MKTMIAAGMAGLMMVTGLPVNTVEAGQREWATAGKILTGVIAGGMILNACKSPPVEREVVYERPVYRFAAVERFHGPPRCAPPVMRACPPPLPAARCESAPARHEPIISYLDEGRRLYQPAIHGHKAVIQVWSEVNGEWVSIKEYPSIW
jgi:hypothetical protein